MQSNGSSLLPPTAETAPRGRGRGGGGGHLLPVSTSVPTTLPSLDTEYAVASSAVSATAVTLCLHLAGPQHAGWASAVGHPAELETPKLRHAAADSDAAAANIFSLAPSTCRQIAERNEGDLWHLRRRPLPPASERGGTTTRAATRRCTFPSACNADASAAHDAAATRSNSLAARPCCAALLCPTRRLRAA